MDKKAQEEQEMARLFSEWRRLGFDMQMLSAIVQNPAPIYDTMLLEWLERANEAEQKLKGLKKMTVQFLTESSYFEIGE